MRTTHRLLPQVNLYARERHVGRVGVSVYVETVVQSVTGIKKTGLEEGAVFS